MTYSPPNILAASMLMPMIGITSLNGAGNIRNISAGQAASGVWSLANRAIFVPFFFPATITVKRMWVVTGATGGTDSRSIGLYREDGTQIVVSANTVAGTANQVQFIDITDTTLAPGSYYVAMSQNGVTATMFRPPHTVEQERVFAVQMAAAYPLPATATFTAITSSTSIPLMGVCTTASP